MPDHHGHQWLTVVERSARILRIGFDRLTRRLPPVVLVAGLAAAAAFSGTLVGDLAFAACGAPPFSFFELGLTFSARSFAALLRTADDCRVGVTRSFVTTDLIFPLLYAPFLCALYLWVERYRRFVPDEGEPGAASIAARTKSPDRPVAGPPLPWSSSLVVILPFVAAVLDVVAENLPLYIAARSLPVEPRGIDGTVGLLVTLGSVAAALKWSILGVYLLGLLLMLLRGPRGHVLWRLRFSGLAVLVGSFAVLLIPQGQDILQRLVEGPDPYARVLVAVFALTCAALVVWYTGRVLSLVRLESGVDQDHGDWLPFFQRNIPRMLGVAVLALAGAAFARAASSLLRFCIVVGLSYVLAELWVYVRRRGLVTMGGKIRPRPLGADVLRGRALLTVALGSLIVWPSSVRPFVWSYEADSTERYALRWAAWLAVSAAWAFYLFVYHRRDLLSVRGRERGEGARLALQRELAVGYPVGAVPRAALRVTLAMVVVSGTFLAAFTFAPVYVGRALGPLVVLALTVANAVLLGSVLAFLGRKFRLPLVTMLLALALIFSGWNDSHEIRTIPAAPTPDTLRTGGQLRERFERWLTARAGDRADSIPILLVAAAGGGLRAAYWSAATLAELQDRDSTFARHVFAISGVSGGSLGAAVFAAMVRDLSGGGAGVACTKPKHGLSSAGPAGDLSGGLISACVRAFMSDDFLSPVLAKMVAPDFLQWFIPFPLRAFDRSTALEHSWEASYERWVGKSTLSAGYLAFHQGASHELHAPMLLLNTTHVQTGRRYVTAPFVDDRAFLDARSVLRAVGADLPLSTAVHNSARFTYVSPAGRIERRDGVSYGALVDGGYFENSGLTTLRDVHRELGAALGELSMAEDSAGLAARRASVAVLYLCNDPRSCRRDLAVDSSLAAGRSLAGEWLSPLIALFRTRDARGSLARAEMARALGARFFQLNVCDSLPYARVPDSTQVKVARARVVNPPLGWQLSQLARDWMDSSLTRGSTGGTVERSDSTYTVGATCRAHNAATMDSIVAMLPARATERP